MSAAHAILKRHVDQRQRFDSADFAMLHSSAATATTDTFESRQGHNSSNHGAPDEHEPEPETAYPQQQVRRIRLQRFDSADWVMDALKANSSTQEAETSDATDAANSTQRAVAKLLLDRHAYTTCQFVRTPVEKRQLFAERA